MYNKERWVMKSVEDYIVTIPDFPEPGIMFRDVTGVLDDAEGLKLAIDELYKKLEGVDYDIIAGAEARGFIFGMPLAYKAGKPFVPIRKKGKLPRETVEKTYDLEYNRGWNFKILVDNDQNLPQNCIVYVDVSSPGNIYSTCSLENHILNCYQLSSSFYG